MSDIQACIAFTAFMACLYAIFELATNKCFFGLHKWGHRREYELIYDGSWKAIERRSCESCGMPSKRKIKHFK